MKCRAKLEEHLQRYKIVWILLPVALASVGRLVQIREKANVVKQEET